MKLIKLMAASVMLFAVEANAAPVPASTNLVSNGGFESNGGTGEISDGISYLTDWTVGATVDGSVHPFNFVLDANADSAGFESVFSNGDPSNFIRVHGPANGTYNGFTGSPSGGYFFGSDGGYAPAPISQVISGLTIGKTYTLSFEWAAGQFTKYDGATTSKWLYSFVPTGSAAVYAETPAANVPNHGFSGWMTHSTTFVASATSQTLTFLANGTPTSAPPFSMLDNVQLTSPVPEPASWAMLIGGFGMIGGMMRARRKPVARLA